MTRPNIPYLTTCPIDGSVLVPIVTNPQTAPWLCRVCSTGWWASELSTEARAAFRQPTVDFSPSVAPAVVSEGEEAVFRGSSARVDQLALLTSSQITTLQSQTLNPAFAAEIPFTPPTPQPPS